MSTDAQNIFKTIPIRMHANNNNNNIGYSNNNINDLHFRIFFSLRQFFFAAINRNIITEECFFPLSLSRMCSKNAINYANKK